jgi:hypothetical protein
MRRSWPYVVIALCLIAFGVLGIFSIGFPFLLTGVVMLALLPLKRSDALVTAIAAIWGFTVTYALAAPLGCSASVSARAGEHAVAVTVCNGVFFDYRGGGGYEPPLLPALLIGVVGGVAAAAFVRAVVRMRSRRVAATG